MGLHRDRLGLGALGLVVGTGGCQTRITTHLHIFPSGWLRIEFRLQPEQPKWPHGTPYALPFRFNVLHPLAGLCHFPGAYVATRA